jgi:hypothetical protein
MNRNDKSWDTEGGYEIEIGLKTITRKQKNKKLIADHVSKTSDKEFLLIACH